MVIAAAQGVAALASAGAAILLARAMGSAGFGEAMVLISLAMLGGALLAANLDAVLLPALARGEDAVLVQARWTVIGLGTLAALGLYSLAQIGVLAPMSAATLALALPALAAMRLLARAGVARGRTAAAVLPRILARPLALLFCGVAALMLSTAPPVWAPLLLLGAAALLAASVQAVALQGRLGAEGQGGHLKRFRQAAAHAPSALMTEFHRPLVVLTAAMVLTPEATGALALALSLAAAPAIAATGVDMAVSPGLAQAVAKTTPDLRPRMARAMRLRVAALALAGAAIALIGPTAVRLAGAEPEVLHLVWILSLGPAARALLGAPLMLLSFAGAFSAAGRLSLGAACASVGLILLGGQAAGALGAALGSSICLIGLSVLARRRAAAHPALVPAFGKGSAEDLALQEKAAPT
ncbi:MAG: hypothetical protein AAFV96_05205 [Pseudomonadota bacterium]